MEATKEFCICRAQLKMDLFPIHRLNTPILFTFVFLTIQPEPLRHVNNSRAGSITRASTKPYFSLMPRTKPISPIQMFRIPYSKFRKQGSARLNCAAFPRTAGSPACVADLQSCRNRYLRGQRTVAGFLCIPFGSGDGVRNRIV